MNFIRGMKIHTKAVAQITLSIAAVLVSISVHAQENVEGAASSQQDSSTAQQPTQQAQQPVYQQYYTVNEDSTETIEIPAKKNVSAFDLTKDFSPAQLAAKAKVVVINILKWVAHNEPLSVPQEKYIRKLHFGRWINDPTDDTCMNTRARVLVRDSEVDVTYKGTRQCTVETGKWVDPYANQEVTEAKGIQIDHLVPLKNAYLSGAWEWDYKTRCLYANYMYFKPHLVSAGGHENMSKSDSGPEKYLPPNEDYRCEYVRNWLAVKTIWKLKLNPDEVQAIADAFKQYKCKVQNFMMSKDGLAQQRDFIEANLNFCMINKR